MELIPKDVLGSLFSFFDCSSLEMCILVCKTFCSVLSEEKIWKQLCERKWIYHKMESDLSFLISKSLEVDPKRGYKWLAKCLENEDCKNGNRTYAFRKDKWFGIISSDGGRFTLERGYGIRITYNQIDIGLFCVTLNSTRKIGLSSNLEWGYQQREDEEYIGPFHRSKYHGQGAWKDSNGIKYHGQFAEGSRHGFGSLEYPNGFKMECSWTYNQPCCGWRGLDQRLQDCIKDRVCTRSIGESLGQFVWRNDRVICVHCASNCVQKKRYCVPRFCFSVWVSCECTNVDCLTKKGKKRKR
jgi:hypothetical protein